MSSSEGSFSAAVTDTVDAVSRAGSTSTALLKPMVTSLLLLAVILTAFSMPAVAGNDRVENTGDVLCGGDDEDSEFVLTLKALMTVLLVAGPALGTVLGAAYTVAMSAQPDGSYEGNRKEVLVAGWSVPVIIYALDVLAGSLLGLNISCIIP